MGLAGWPICPQLQTQGPFSFGFLDENQKRTTLWVVVLYLMLQLPFFQGTERIGVGFKGRQKEEPNLGLSTPPPINMEPGTGYLVKKNGLPGPARLRATWWWGLG